MPATDYRAKRWDDGELVVGFTTIDGSHETDERVFGTREGLGRHGHNILDASVIDSEVHPLIGAVKHEAVGIGGF